MSTVEQVVAAIHATPHKLVLAFAGAGVSALTWLHGVGGSSRTVLSAIDIYAHKSMAQLIGYAPSNFTVPRVARSMAAASLRLAKAQLDDGSTDPAFGLGSTATIATDRLKRGDHRVALAVRDALGNVDYALVFDKGVRDRAGEEEIVGLLILRAIADASGVLGVPDLPLTESEELQTAYQPSEMLAALASGMRGAVLVKPDGTAVAGDGLAARAILSGAFNPLHVGHLELAAAASQRTGLPQAFELPLMNAAKSPIGLLEARRRVQQFAGRAPVVLTNAPLFADKAALFPGSVFVVGVDTAERIVSPRFYGYDPGALAAALQRIRDHGCRFLVAGRVGGDEFRSLADIDLPPGTRDLFEELSEGEFRRDVSSTALRSAWPTDITVGREGGPG